MTAPVRLGVVMLCHEELALAARMARLWARGGAQVMVHVDARAPAAPVDDLRADLADLAGQVHLAPRVACEWGRFSLVRATQIAAERLLALDPDISHVLLVSGACLPLRPVGEICAYLAARPGCDFIESVTVGDAGWTVGGLSEERFTLRFPFSYRRQRWLFDRHVELQRRLRFRRRIPQGLVPHLGSQWWCLTCASLQAILNDPRRAEFDRYFRRVWIPDESYFQSLIRRHARQIESRSLTFSRFDAQGRPFLFYDDHLTLLEQSRCFLVRKVWRGAQRLHEHFPRPATTPDAEPRPQRLERMIDQAVQRRCQGRPGLYMQSRFPVKDREIVKTAAPYAVLQGFSDLFADFPNWLGARLDADVHGHLFASDGIGFAGGAALGPGAFPDNPAMRDLDPRGFLASLVRLTPRMQVWQHSPRDNQALAWFMATDPHARMFLITGAWAVPLMHSGMPFDDIRRMAARLQRAELAQIEAVRSVWCKAQVQVWDLADFCARPLGVLQSVLRELGAGTDAATDLPAMRPVAGMGDFLQRLRNAGLRPQLMGDFPITGAGGAAARERSAP